MKETLDFIETDYFSASGFSEDYDAMTEGLASDL